MCHYKDNGNGLTINKGFSTYGLLISSTNSLRVDLGVVRINQLRHKMAYGKLIAVLFVLNVLVILKSVEGMNLEEQNLLEN